MPTAPAIALIPVFLAIGSAFAADWNYAGNVNIGRAQESAQFVDSETIALTPEGTTRVWMKTVRMNALIRRIEKLGKDGATTAGIKAANGYVPKFLDLPFERARYPDAASRERATAMVGLLEAGANSVGGPVTTQSYFEIDCSGRRMRLLENLTYKSNGSVERIASQSSEYAFVAPESNGEKILLIVCNSKWR